MAKNKYNIDAGKIARWIEEGRGSGELGEYRPWLRVYDVPSRGLSTRIKGWKTGRIHHLLSLLELHFFYLFDWSFQILDIREQFPLLPWTDTQQIAKDLGIRHPFDTKTKHSRVMTTDFVLTCLENGKIVYHAVSIKYNQDLTKRNLDKFEIERLYWLNKGVKAVIRTELDLPLQFAKNVRLLHPYRDSAKLSLPQAKLDTAIDELTQQAIANPQCCLSIIGSQCDNSFGFVKGTSLNIVKHLLATNRWNVDMNHPIKFTKPLLSLSIHHSNQVQVRAQG